MIQISPASAASRNRTSKTKSRRASWCLTTHGGRLNASAGWSAGCAFSAGSAPAGRAAPENSELQRTETETAAAGLMLLSTPTGTASLGERAAQNTIVQTNQTITPAAARRYGRARGVTARMLDGPAADGPLTEASCFNRRMSDQQPSMLEGRISRKKSNALTMTFIDGSPEPVGLAVQGGGGDGFGRKMGVLFGFKNGGTGVHLYTPASGPALRIESRDKEPSLLTREDGSAVAQVDRSEGGLATDASGAPILRWIDHPEDAKTLEAFRLSVLRPNGEAVADLRLIRTVAGWSLGRAVMDDMIWFGRAGQALPIPFLGTSVRILSPLTPAEHEVLIASCIDMAIGLRPYGTAMR